MDGAVEPSQRLSCKLKVRVTAGQIVECYHQEQVTENFEKCCGEMGDEHSR